MFIKKLLPIILTGLVLNSCGSEEKQSTTESTKPTATASSTVNKANATTTYNLPANAPILKVCTEAKLLPFDYYTEKGELIGFDVDIIRTIAAQQGMKAEFTDLPWEGLLDRLNTDQCEIIVHLLGVNEERLSKYDATDAYVDAPEVLMVPADSPIKKFEDLKHVTIGVLKNSSGKAVVEKAHLTGVIIKEKDSFLIAASHLLSANKEENKVDAVVGDKLILQNLIIESNEKDKVRFIDLNLPNYDSSAVFYVRKGNTELLNKINTGIKAIKEDGHYDKIYAKWFG